jgi:hypothetical protein
MSPGELGLRRADWRLLLPAPAGGQFRHLVLLGGPAGLDRELMRLGTAAQVSTTLPETNQADALVILRGARTPLSRATRCLGADGIVYWEIERRSWAGFAKGRWWISRQLRKAGLEPYASYWVIPDFQNARRYLPVDHPHAVEWFFATRFLASTPGRVFLEHSVRWLQRRHLGMLASWVPARAVVAGRAGRTPTAFTALATSGLPGALGEPGIRPVLITSGQDDGSRVAVLPFREGAREPEVVIKLARLAGFVGHTEREQATLLKLRGALPPDLRQSLPEPEGRVGSHTNPAFLERAVPGRMVAASTGRWRATLARQVEDLQLAVNWLIHFHRSTLVRRLPWSAAEFDRLVEPSLGRYEKTFVVDARVTRLFARVRSEAGNLAGQHLPIVWCHNDFNPWHVYLAGSRVSVIDWEFVGEDVTARQGPALCDLVYFLVSWVYLARGLRGTKAESRGFAELFVVNSGGDPRSLAARRALRDYVIELDMHPGFAPLLTVFTWVDRAVDWHQRQVAAGASQAWALRANPFTRYVRLLGSGCDELFERRTAGPAS